MVDNLPVAAPNAIIPSQFVNPEAEPRFRLQYVWDSTSLGLLKNCPRKFYLSIIEGWSKKESSVHLKFGGWFASALELYHKTLTSRACTHDEALDATLQSVLEWTASWLSDHPKKTRETLVRSIIWYLDAYADDPALTLILADGRPAVELSFKMEIDMETPLGEPYLLAGHIDRMVSYAGDPFVMDQKTSGSSVGAYFFAQFNPDNQMSLYTLAGRTIFNIPVAGVIIDAAQIAVGFTTFARGFTMRTEAQLDEWLGDTKEWIALAEHFASRGVWPMNDKSCHQYDGCPFRGVCDKDPSVRANYLSTYFERREWNPLRPR